MPDGHQTQDDDLAEAVPTSRLMRRRETFGSIRSGGLKSQRSVVHAIGRQRQSSLHPSPTCTYRLCERHVVRFSIDPYSASHVPFVQGVRGPVPAVTMS
jgi:hypothetical protein